MATTTAVSPAAPEPQSQMSAISRMFGVLFSPQKTFEDIVRKPSWLIPIIVLTILSIGVSFALIHRVNWRDYISQQIEKSPQAAQLSPEQKEQRIEVGVKFTVPFTYAIGTCGPILAALIFALVFWGAYSLLGGASTNFSTAFEYYRTCADDRAGEQSTADTDFVFERPEHDRRGKSNCVEFGGHPAGRFGEMADSALQVV